MFSTPTFFSPVTSPDVEISSQNVLSFVLKPFYNSAVNFNYDKYSHKNARVTKLWSNDHICNTIWFPCEFFLFDVIDLYYEVITLISK